VRQPVRWNALATCLPPSFRTSDKPETAPVGVAGACQSHLARLTIACLLLRLAFILELWNSNILIVNRLKDLCPA
jgi:hypothetical protein